MRDILSRARTTRKRNTRSLDYSLKPKSPINTCLIRDKTIVFFSCFLFFFYSYLLSCLSKSNDRCAHTKCTFGLRANIELGERQRRASQSRCRPISERFGDRGGQDPIVEDLRRRDRNVFTELPPFRPFAISTFRSFFVSFRESMSWPSSIITVSSPWCRRRCASSPLPRDRSLAFYALKEEHNIMVCADNILHFVVSKCDVGLFKSVTLTHYSDLLSPFFYAIIHKLSFTILFHTEKYFVDL